ncbi:hypothetical protein HZB00_00190 [Candidatus Woesearchaeota archaeon]|nr:hypothetical protein [Candidatus Woesearchaeota archaeon]
MAGILPAGKVTHFYPKIGVAIVRLDKPLRQGDKIAFEDGNRAFTQQVSSIEIDHIPVFEANRGRDVGVRVEYQVRRGALVYKL